MENIKLNKIVIIFLIFILSSCASFSKRRFRNEIENLNTENITKLNGNYSFNPIKRYYNFGKPNLEDNNSDSLRYTNAYIFLLNKSLYKYDKFDSISTLKNKFEISLQLENENLLKIKVSNNLKIIKDTTLTGKFRKGMFYLDNKFLECNGIPYLFGGCRNNKRRIGITKNGNLLINEAVNNEGALLLIIGGGFSGNTTYEFKKIK